jgi:hypothetical protein
MTLQGRRLCSEAFRALVDLAAGLVEVPHA